MPTEQLSTTTQRPPDLQQLTASGAADTDVLTAFVETDLRSRDLERGDLKIMHRTVRELRYALSVFARYRHVRKVSQSGTYRWGSCHHQLRSTK